MNTQTLKSEISLKLEKVNNQITSLEKNNQLGNQSAVVIMFQNGLSIGLLGVKPFVSASLFAKCFDIKTAQELCNKITNGRGEHPFIAKPIEYYRRKKVFLEKLVRTL